MAKTPNTRRRGRKDRKGRNRRNRRRTMRGGVDMNPAPLDYSLANSWSSKASLNQGEDFFKYHREQHGGADSLMGAPYPGQVLDSTLPKDLVGMAHMNGINKALTDIIGLNDREGTPAIVPSQSGGPANTTGGRRRRRRTAKKTRRNRKDRKDRKDRNRSRNRRNRKTMCGGSNHLGYSSVNAPTMLLPNREAYSAAALNPEYVSMKGYAEGIAAEARDKITYA